MHVAHAERDALEVGDADVGDGGEVGRPVHGRSDDGRDERVERVRRSELLLHGDLPGRDGWCCDRCIPARGRGVIGGAPAGAAAGRAGRAGAVSPGAGSRHHWRMALDADSTGRRRARRPRRRRSALLLIVLVGLVAIAVAFALAGALDDDRPHGPYLIGAWTFGDRASLDAAVKAGAIDEVSADWLQSRADGSVAAPRLDTDFLAAVRHDDCRVFVTLTDYDESRHTFDPAISAAVLATSGSRRRHAEAVAAWCKTYDVAGVDVDWEAVKGSRRDAVLRLRRGARPAAARRRPPHRRRRLPQAQGARRLGRPARAGLGAPRARRGRVPRHDLQLLRLLVGPGTALAAGLDGPGDQLRRDAGGAAAHRHGPRLLRARLAGLQDDRPPVGRRDRHPREPAPA